jgi:16S rRNA (adenine1518-N6/adenine1519-N6)-dimethyltransferase
MFKTKKSLGQNFLNNQSIVEQIVDVSNIKRSDVVLEIGPGKGVLTKELLKKAKIVVAIEKDRRLIASLKRKFKDYDILDFDIAENIKGDYKVVANIPYYITGAVIKKFLTTNQKPQTITLMVQKEVGQRITSKDGKESVLSLSVKAFGDPEYVRTVKRGNFDPKPKVDSAILLIKNINSENFDTKEEQVLFFEIIKKAFGGKRKKIGTTLKVYKEKISDLRIDVNKRPEDLSIEEWLEVIKKINSTLR